MENVSLSFSQEVTTYWIKVKGKRNCCIKNGPRKHFSCNIFNYYSYLSWISIKIRRMKWECSFKDIFNQYLVIFQLYFQVNSGQSSQGVFRTQCNGPNLYKLFGFNGPNEQEKRASWKALLFFVPGKQTSVQNEMKIFMELQSTHYFY